MLCYNIGRLVHRTRKGAKSKRLAYHFTGHCTKDKCNMTTIKIPLSKYGKHRGKFQTIVDVVDRELEQYNWSVCKSRRNPYAQRTDYSSNRKQLIQMHRVILARKLERDELLSHELVDHINGDSLDNRRENLRLVTSAQNSYNRRINANNTSGYKGVSLQKQTGKWIGYLRMKGKMIYVGRFSTSEEAYKAVCKKREELHGEFTNHG